MRFSVRSRLSSSLSSRDETLVRGNAPPEKMYTQIYKLACGSQPDVDMIATQSSRPAKSIGEDVEIAQCTIKDISLQDKPEKAQR
jgi:hypothetical protein